MCLIPTKPQSFRDGVPVSWKKEKCLFHRCKNLFQKSPGCSAKALVHYGRPSTILKLLTRWDTTKARLPSLISRGTNSIMVSGTENTSGSNVRADLSTSHTAVLLPNLLLRKLVTPVIQMMFHCSTVWQDPQEVKHECWRIKEWVARFLGHINYWLTVKTQICASLWTLCHV